MSSFSCHFESKAHLEPNWYIALKAENCCLKIFVKIRVGEKVCEKV